MFSTTHDRKIEIDFCGFYHDEPLSSASISLFPADWGKRSQSPIIPSSFVMQIYFFWILSLIWVSDTPEKETNIKVKLSIEYAHI